MRKRTPISFRKIINIYEAGIGNQEQQEKIMVNVGKTKTDIFYCEWLTSYGNLAIQQQQQGIIEGAKVRMPYIATLVDALRNHQIIIYKNAIEDKNNQFILNSSIEDIKEHHKEIEFQVKRLVEK